VEGDKKYSGYDKIISHLKKDKGYSLNSSDAYLSYLRDNLSFFHYQLWGNPQNKDETRTLYAKRTPFPFNFYYPGRYMSKTDELCQTVAGWSTEDVIELQDTSEMSLKAKKCINWISEKLSTNEFLINGSPTEVDATIYAYLAIILKFQMPNNQLQSHALQCSNLVSYVNNITKKYFKESEVHESPKAKAKSQKQEQKVFTGQELDEDSPSDVRRRYFLSGLFASTAMISYALFTGIFTVIVNSTRCPTFS